ncbi:pilus biogenesis protein [Pseudorhodoferax aquiterrae]|uniref:Ribonuclease VapC n=2 Tax=Pseudorhodoferax aquiterrae TaxID=747304 RepID=A0ABQ3G2K6_9BURK|nr:pilus biogenesis protein [Pseudorhodoferax aquiterrae]
MPGPHATRGVAASTRMVARKTPALAVREPSAPWLAHAGSVLVDSGPLIALFNGTDRWHAPVRSWLRANPAASLVTTWCVATEVCALLARRIHNDAALDFLRWAQRGAIALDRAAEGSLTEVLRLSERFADLPFDLADASVAEAAARLKLRHILSIDADFDVYRDRAGRPLVNLLRR